MIYADWDSWLKASLLPLYGQEYLDAALSQGQPMLMANNVPTGYSGYQGYQGYSGFDSRSGMTGKSGPQNQQYVSPYEGCNPTLDGLYGESCSNLRGTRRTSSAAEIAKLKWMAENDRKLAIEKYKADEKLCIAKTIAEREAQAEKEKSYMATVSVNTWIDDCKYKIKHSINKCGNNDWGEDRDVWLESMRIIDKYNDAQVDRFERVKRKLSSGLVAVSIVAFASVFIVPLVFKIYSLVTLLVAPVGLLALEYHQNSVNSYLQNKFFPKLKDIEITNFD